MLRITRNLLKLRCLSTDQHCWKRCHTTLGAKIDLSSNVGSRMRLKEEAYCNDMSTAIPQPYGTILEELVKETEKKFEKAFMMVSPLQAKLLHQLLLILRPRRVLEIGGFTGYSAIAMASALSSSLATAELVSLEKSAEHAEIARSYVQKANLSDIIKIMVGPAEESLEKLKTMRNGEHKAFDFIFLDANKKAYIRYYDLIMRHDLLNENGIIVADNVLHWGQVHREAGYEEDDRDLVVGKNVKKVASEVHRFNKHIKGDPRVDILMLPLFDGLSVIRKKSTV